MRKVKLVKCSANDSIYWDTSVSEAILAIKEQSDWEEISDEDYKYLCDPDVSDLLLKQGIKMFVFEDLPVKSTLISIKEEIKKQRDILLKAKNARHKQILEREAKRKQREIEKAKRLLEKEGVL